MSALRKLAGQTAIYGLSSIVARFLNFLLTPLYTSKAVFAPDDYGVITALMCGRPNEHTDTNAWYIRNNIRAS